MDSSMQGSDVTCWKCGFLYSLQRKFCIKCGSKPTPPASVKPAFSSTPSPTSSAKSITSVPSQPSSFASVGGPSVTTSPSQPASSPPPAGPAGSATAARHNAPHQHQHKPVSSDTALSAADIPTSGSAVVPIEASLCAECGSELSGTVVTDASGRSYHHSCFKCSQCGKVLTGDYHVVKGNDHGKDRFYCTEDFIAAHSPACVVCSKPITGCGAEDHTGAKYHLECFACKRCGKPISNKYIVDAKGDLCCGQCHSSNPSSGDVDNSAAFRCGGCGGELEGQVVGVGDIRYHKQCFVCPICKIDLTDNPFHLENGQLRCKKCLLTEKGEICAACNLVIEEGALQAMTKLWHENCFKCGDCSHTIQAGQSFAAKGDVPICATCASNY